MNTGEQCILSSSLKRSSEMVDTTGLCKETPQCSVNFWTDRNHIPQSAWMPVPDLAVMTASYTRHPSYAEPRVQLACWLYPSKAIGEAVQCEYQPGAKRPPEK